MFSSNLSVKFVIFLESASLYKKIKGPLIETLGVIEDEKSVYSEIFKDKNSFKSLSTDLRRAGQTSESTRVNIDRRDSKYVPEHGKDLFMVTDEEICLKTIISKVFDYNDGRTMFHTTDFNITCICVFLDKVSWNPDQLINLLIRGETNIISFIVSSNLTLTDQVSKLSVKLYRPSFHTNNDKKWYIADLDFIAFYVPGRMVESHVDLNEHGSPKYLNLFGTLSNALKFRLLALIDIKVSTEYYYFLMKKIAPKHPKRLSKKIIESSEEWEDVFSQVEVKD